MYALTDRKRLGATIRYYRQQEFSTQRAFALHIDMHPNCYGRIERGETDVCLGTFAQICTHLNQHPWNLLIEAQVCHLLSPGWLCELLQAAGRNSKLLWPFPNANNSFMFEHMRKYESRNPNFMEYTRYKISKNKFLKWLGMEITKIEPGYIEAKLEFKEMHEQQNGWLHGGVTSAILDVVEGYAAYSLVEDGTQVFTAEAKISYYNPGIASKFYARGWVDKPGKRFHFCQGEIYYLNQQGEEVTVAKGSTTMAVV